jgi:solute carrier family 25 carnitine/acylcarnitine transporter 20/29
MQIQQGFTNANAFDVAAKIFRYEGIPGFFKGCVPPLWGSMVYRGVMMSTFESAYTWIEQNNEKDSWYRTEIGLGVRPIIPISGFLAAFTRGFVESK